MRFERRRRREIAIGDREHQRKPAARRLEFGFGFAIRRAMRQTHAAGDTATGAGAYGGDRIVSRNTRPIGACRGRGWRGNRRWVAHVLSITIAALVVTRRLWSCG